jgi:hypothetical protein
MCSGLRGFAARQLVALHHNPVPVDATGSFSTLYPTQLVLKSTPSRALRASGNTARPSIRTTASPCDGASKSACMPGALLLLRWWIGYGALMVRKVRHNGIAADDKSVTEVGARKPLGFSQGMHGLPPTHGEQLCSPVHRRDGHTRWADALPAPTTQTGARCTRHLAPGPAGHWSAAACHRSVPRRRSAGGRAA